MRTTFELNGLIIDIGNDVLDDLDTTGTLASSPAAPGMVALSIYRRDLEKPKTIRCVCGAFLKASDAETVAVALHGAAIANAR